MIEQKDPKTSELSFFNIDNNQRNLVHQAKVEGKFANVFPAYIAFQSSPSDVDILSLKEDPTVDEVRTVENATLLYGNFNELAMLVNATSLAHAQPLEIQIRLLADVMTEKPEFFISKRTLTAGNLKRVTSYEKTFNVDDDGNLSEKFTMIPGGVKNQFGWYEEIKSFNSTSKVVTKKKTIFHTSGNEKSHEVVEGEAKNFTDEEEEKEDFTQSLMDKSKTLEIADLTPYKVIDENFVHFGFETYENSFVGGSSAWKFSERNVKRKSFSLTGESFLRLSESGDSFLVDVFNANGNVIASIKPNGAISRKLYDKNHKEVASVNAEGNLVELRTSTTGRLVVPTLVENHPSLSMFKAQKTDSMTPSNGGRNARLWA